MKDDVSNLAPLTSSGGDAAPDLHARTLVIGDLSTWLQGMRSLPGGSRIAVIQFRELDAGVLAAIRPRIVLSPLLSRGFDCLDLAERLNALGFDGQYRALADSLPDAGIVRHEVAQQFPGLDFDIVTAFDPPGAA